MAHWLEKIALEKDEYHKECLNVGQEISSKGANFLMCCVDGSSQSDVAFQSAMNLRKKFDHVNVFHAYIDKPDLQPASWRPKSLESKYEVELTGRIPKSLFSLTFVDRSGDTVNNVLEQVVDPVAFQPGGEGTILPARPDFIIMGHHGRKGPKERKASIGSTADRALRNLHYPCMIVKNLVPAGPRSYLMAVNDSNVSKRGFDVLMRLVNPRDTLQLVYFANRELSSPQEKFIIRDYYTKELQEVGPVNSEFKIIDCPAHTTLANTIIDYVNESTADVFVIAPRTTQHPSSLTNELINSVPITMLLCKN